MPFSGIHDEDIQYSDNIRQQLADIVEGLERSHRHAEYMRRDMIERMNLVAESRDFWESEATRILVDLERYRTILEERKWT